MKFLKKILLVMLVIFAVIFSVGYGLVSIFGKDILKAQIEKQLKVKVGLSSLYLSLPLNLEINNLSLGELAKIRKIKIFPSIIGLFSGKIILNNIALIKPEIALERKEDGSLNLPQLPEQGNKQVFVAGLIIKDGIVSIVDRKVNGEAFSFSIKNININIYKANLLPYPLTIKYALSAALNARPDTKEAQIEGEGTIDWPHKNMQGDFNITGIDVLFFKPYFGKIVSSQEQLATSKADFNADLSAQNNDLLIKCRLNVKNLASAKETAPEAKEGAEEPPQGKSSGELLASLGMDLLKSPQGEINLEFDIRTKLDNPRLDKISLKGSVFQNVLENALENPDKIKDTIKTIGEQLKEKGFKSIFKDKE